MKLPVLYTKITVIEAPKIKGNSKKNIKSIPLKLNPGNTSLKNKNTAYSD